MIYNYTGYISSAQAAKQIGISRQGLMKAIHENRIDAYRMGCIWMLKPDDVDKFKANRSAR